MSTHFFGILARIMTKQDEIVITTTIFDLSIKLENAVVMGRRATSLLCKKTLVVFVQYFLLHILLFFMLFNTFQ